MSKILKNCSDSMPFSNVLHAAPHSVKKHAKDCRLCEYLRETYPQITSGEEVEGFFSASHEKAKSEGYEVGRIEAEKLVSSFYDSRLKTLEDELEQVCNSLFDAMDQYRLKAEKELVNLSLEVARKVLAAEPSINPEAVLSIAKSAMERVASTEHAKLKVNLSDSALVQSHREELVALIEGTTRLEIVEDRRVPPGGAVVETENGTVDARIDTQYWAIHNALKEA